MITPEEIARLRELGRNATPGPFRFIYNIERRFNGVDAPTCEVWVESSVFTSNDRGEAIQHASAERNYFEAAANELPSLLDEIERLQDECDTLRYEAVVLGDGIKHHKDAAKRCAAYVEKIAKERNAALKRAEVAEAELHVLRLSHAHGEHDDRCPRCEAERHWKEGVK